MAESPLVVALLADGGHVNCERWCEGLRQAGAEVHLISFRVGKSAATRSYGIPVSRLAGRLRYVISVGHVRRLLRKIQPDIVVAYYVTGYGTLARLSGHHPLVQVTSGTDILIAPGNPAMRALLRFNLRKADMVTAWGPHMAQAVRQLGVADDRIFVLPRGIPLQRFTSTRCLAPNSSESARIISTRSLKPGYNTRLLLRSIGLLRDIGMAVDLTIAGEGPQRESLVACCRRLQLEQEIHFAGFVDNDNLPTMLAAHNVYISLPDSDGVSASLLEAMATGLLPIVPDLPANRQWIKSGENGLLLESLSPTAVAEAVLKAMLDLPLRQRAWRQNPEIVRARADLYRNSKVFLEQFKQLSKRRLA